LGLCNQALHFAPGGPAIYAIVRTGGKQYRVEPDQLLDVDLLHAEVGSTIDLGDVLLVSGGADVRVGTPLVSGARVVAEVVEHGRGKKIRVFKYKNKTRYRRLRGHRQDFTRLQIREILAEGIVIDAEPEEKPRAKKRAAPKAKAEAVAAEPEAEETATAETATAETPEVEDEAEAEAPEVAAEAPAAAAAEKPKRAPRKATPKAKAGTGDKPAPKPRTRKKADSGE
jgi:large subunit ribosomal protein L21